MYQKNMPNRINTEERLFKTNLLYLEKVTLNKCCDEWTGVKIRSIHWFTHHNITFHRPFLFSIYHFGFYSQKSQSIFCFLYLYTNPASESCMLCLCVFYSKKSICLISQATTKLFCILVKTKIHVWLREVCWVTFFMLVFSVASFHFCTCILRQNEKSSVCSGL